MVKQKMIPTIYYQNDLIQQGLHLIDIIVNNEINCGCLYLYMAKEDLEDMKSECKLIFLKHLVKYKKDKTKLSTFMSPIIIGCCKDFNRKFLRRKKMETQINIEQIQKNIQYMESIQFIELNLLLENYDCIKKEFKPLFIKVLKEEFFNMSLNFSVIKKIFGLNDDFIILLLSSFIFENNLKKVNEELGLNITTARLSQIRKKIIKQLKQKI